MINNISINLPVSVNTGMDSVKVSTADDGEKQQIKIPSVKENSRISDDVLMDLKDVQNFLFMITGTDLSADSGKTIKNSTIDFVA
jgi:hypothetical protein